MLAVVKVPVVIELKYAVRKNNERIATYKDIIGDGDSCETTAAALDIKFVEITVAMACLTYGSEIFCRVSN